MTSQMEKAEREVLNEKAKNLGIKSPHMCGDQTLQAKVKEMEDKIVADGGTLPEPEEKAEKRSTAPKMVISNINTNNREKRIAELEKANPENKYVFKKAGTTNEQLRALGLKSTGEYVKNDLICVTEKKSFIEWQDAKKDGQRKMMDSIDSIGTKIKSHTSVAKAPPKKGD